MDRKIFTRAVWIVSFVSLFTDIASEMLYPIMPVFLKSIGFSVVLIGILEGVAEATAGISKGYFGNLSDKVQKRVPFIRTGYLMSAVSKPMMALFVFPWWIFIARTIDRLGKGIRTSARDALLSDESTAENKGKVFGLHRAMDTLGAAIGPILALLFLWKYPGNYTWLFIIAFLPGIIAISLTFLLKDRKQNKHSDQRASKSFFSYLGYWKIAPSAYKKMVVPLLLFTVFNSTDAFLLLYLKYKGFSDTQMISFYIFYNLVYAAMSLPVGIIADKLGLKRIIAFGFLIFAVVYGTMPLANSWIIFGLLFGLYALYASATEGVSKALITNIAQKEHVATAIGFYSSFSSICALLASSLGGIIWYSFSPEAMLWFSAGGSTIAALLIMRLKINPGYSL